MSAERLQSITEKQQSIFERPKAQKARPPTSPMRAPEAAGSWGQGSGRASMSPQGSRAGRSQRAPQPLQGNPASAFQSG